MNDITNTIKRKQNTKYECHYYKFNNNSTNLDPNRTESANWRKKTTTNNKDSSVIHCVDKTTNRVSPLVETEVVVKNQFSDYDSDNILSANNIWKVDDVTRHILYVADSKTLLMLGSVCKKLRELFIKSIVPTTQLSLLIVRFRISSFNLRDLITSEAYEIIISQINRKANGGRYFPCQSIDLQQTNLQGRIAFASQHHLITLKIESKDELIQLNTLILNQYKKLKDSKDMLLQVRELDLSNIPANYLTYKLIDNLLAFFADAKQLKVLNLGDVATQLTIKSYNNLETLTCKNTLRGSGLILDNCQKLMTIKLGEKFSNAGLMLNNCPNATVVRVKTDS